MTTKQKAEAYDKAKIRMREFLKEWENCGAVGEALEKAQNVFPELRENEDEKIREDILLYIGAKDDISLDTHNRWLSWLEKQSDTNEIINRDEFTKGVLRGAAVNLISYIDYNKAEGNMRFSNIECKDIEDALVSGDWDKIYAYMKKKLGRQGKQKFIWSEEDKTMSRFIGNAITSDDASTYLESKGVQVIDAHVWLDELKDRVQSKQEWSEEDKDYYDVIISKLEVTQDDAALTDNQMEFLKSLKDRVQLKQEWDEEDEVMIKVFDSIIGYIVEVVDKNVLERFGTNRKELFSWLKSLRPQNTWKPSEEQIKALDEVYKTHGANSACRRILITLLNDLEKLK